MNRIKYNKSSSKLIILSIMIILLMLIIIFLSRNIYQTNKMIKAQTVQTFALQELSEELPKENLLENILTDTVVIENIKQDSEEEKIVTVGDKEIKIPKVKVASVNDKEDIQNKAGDNSTSSANAPKLSAEESIEMFENKETSVGIDVSKWQGNIDWAKVRDAGIEFVMIRVGYRGSTTGNIYMDPYFTKNINGAISNGIYVGIYFFSMATTEEEAIQEAAWTVEAIKKYKITFPVAYDFESFGQDRVANVSNDQMNNNAVAFLNYIKSQGYKASLYGSKNALNNRWNMSKFGSFQVWLAHYTQNTNYTGRYNMWQYTDSGSVDGINGKVDMNIAYIKYPKQEIKKEEKKEEKPIVWETTD